MPTLPANSYGVGLAGSRRHQFITGIDFVDYSECIGGSPNDEEFQPSGIMYSPSGRIMSSDNSILRLFRDITAAELTSGEDWYKCLFVLYAGTEAVENLSCYLVQPQTGVTVSLWKDPAVTGETERIANELTAPSRAVWTAPSSGSPMVLSTSFSSTSATIPLWFKLTAAPAARAYSFDYFDLHVTSSNYTERIYRFYFNRLAGKTISSITSSRDGEVPRVQENIRYTITCSGDPAGNLVHVFGMYDSKTPLKDTNYTPGEVREAWDIIGQARRISAGVFYYDLSTPYPGLYRLIFSIGEDEEFVNQWIAP